MSITNWNNQREEIQRRIRNKLEQQQPLREQIKTLDVNLFSETKKFFTNFYILLEQLSNEENSAEFTNQEKIIIAYFLEEPLALSFEEESLYNTIKNEHYELCQSMFCWYSQGKNDAKYAEYALQWLEANEQLKHEQIYEYRQLTEAIQTTHTIISSPIQNKESFTSNDQEEVSFYSISQNEEQEIKKEIQLKEEEKIRKTKKQKKRQEISTHEVSQEENYSTTKKSHELKKEKDFSKRRDVKIAQKTKNEIEERQEKEKNFETIKKQIQQVKERKQQLPQESEPFLSQAMKQNSSTVIFKQLSIRYEKTSGASLFDEMQEVENPILKLLHDDDPKTPLLNLTESNLKIALNQIPPQNINNDITPKDILIKKLEALQEAFNAIKINSLLNEKNRYSKPLKQPFWQTYNLDLSETQRNHIHMLKKAALSISLELVTKHCYSSKEIISHANDLIKFNRTLIKLFVKKEDNLFFKKTTTEKEIHKAAKRLIPSG